MVLPRKLTLSSIRKGIEFFRRAIDADPTYALAYAGLADAYRRLPISSDIPPKEAFPMGKAAAMHALQMDPHLAQAHMSLGFIHFWFDWDWEHAENEFQRSIELDPEHAETHMSYAVMLTGLGRFRQAIEEGQRSVELNPLSLIVTANFGWVLHCSGHGAEARVQLERALRSIRTSGWPTCTKPEWKLRKTHIPKPSLHSEKQENSPAKTARRSLCWVTHMRLPEIAKMRAPCSTHCKQPPPLATFRPTISR